MKKTKRIRFSKVTTTIDNITLGKHLMSGTAYYTLSTIRIHAYTHMCTHGIAFTQPSVLLYA